MEQQEELRSVWLHVHVPKAGGSTLRQLMNRNFGEGFYNSNSLLETKQYTRDDVSEIIRCHPWLKCFCDHKLSLNLPWHHEHAKVRALAFVREPLERFISRYFFHRNFEEVNCIAQQMTFREFAVAELVEKHAHPQTNSQIFFLNNGMGSEDMSVIDYAIGTGQAFLFPIERFDDACVCLERSFPNDFKDLSYVKANVSKKDIKISQEDRDFALQYLKIDYPVFELAQKQLDAFIESTFENKSAFQAAMEDFKTRCSQWHNNFNKVPRQDEASLPDTKHASIRNRATSQAEKKQTQAPG